jgi:hypothetical protein
MLVKLELIKENGSPAKNELVELHGEGGFFSSSSVSKNKTDQDGKVELTTDSEFIEKVTVAGVTIKQNWDISGKQEIYEKIEIPDPENIESKDGLAEGIKGVIYWHDGTAAHRELLIEVEVTNSDDANRYKAYCKDNGSFFVKMPYQEGSNWYRELRFFVGGSKIERKRIHFKGMNYVVIILPDMFASGKGDSGGVITGMVIDKHGQPIENAKVEATPVSGGLFSMFSANHTETKTNGSGRFALQVEGCLEVNNLMVNGNPPIRATRKKKDGSQVLFDNNNYSVGTFGLTLTAKRKLFG